MPLVVMVKKLRGRVACEWYLISKLKPHSRRRIRITYRSNVVTFQLSKNTLHVRVVVPFTRISANESVSRVAFRYTQDSGAADGVSGMLPGEGKRSVSHIHNERPGLVRSGSHSIFEPHEEGSCEITLCSMYSGTPLNVVTARMIWLVGFVVSSVTRCWKNTVRGASCENGKAVKAVIVDTTDARRMTKETQGWILRLKGAIGRTIRKESSAAPAYTKIRKWLNGISDTEENIHTHYGITAVGESLA